VARSDDFRERIQRLLQEEEKLLIQREVESGKSVQELLQTGRQDDGQHSFVRFEEEVDFYNRPGPKVTSMRTKLDNVSKHQCVEKNGRHSTGRQRIVDFQTAKIWILSPKMCYGSG
jgi:hypothetical protein